MSPPSPTVLPTSVDVTLAQPIDGWYPVSGGYVETHWLPVVGPTAFVVARRLYLIGIVAGYGEVVSHLSEVLGRMCGVHQRPLANGVGRLNMFGLAHWITLGDPPLLSMRSTWPPLPRRHLDRFSDFLPVID